MHTHEKNEYDNTAWFYDQLLFLPLWHIRKKVMKELKKYKTNQILDLCCGTGNQLKILAKDGFENLHCLDFSEAMLEIAKKGDYPIKIYNEDATNTSLKDSSFDVITISFAIHEKPRKIQEGILKEAKRILRTSGLLLIVDYDIDKETTFLSKLGIYGIERAAGKLHYFYFKNFIKNKGLESLIDKNIFKLEQKEKVLLKGVAISQYRKIEAK